MYLLALLQGFEKVIQGFMVRGSWRPNRNYNILIPTLMAVSVVFLVLQMLNQRPTLLGDGFLYCILSATSLDPNSSGPKAPSTWCGFTYHISSISFLTGTVLTELYNSSTPTQSPTRSLEWHDWSSCSSQVTFFRCISLSVPWEFFYLVPFHQPISAHAISSHNCH